MLLRSPILPPNASASVLPECEAGFRAHKRCKTFVGMQQPNCGIEWDEWMMVRALVRPHHRVLELGARYGTTSCALARATQNSGRVVAAHGRTMGGA